MGCSPKLALTPRISSTKTGAIDMIPNSMKYARTNLVEVLPQELRAMDHWISWKAGAVKPDGKFDKIPYGRDGRGSGWQRDHQWMGFEEAVTAAKQRGHSGIGIVLPASFPDGSHLVALDFDTVDLTESPGNNRLIETQALHEKLNFPYIEVSPSGKGIRMFVRSAIPIAQVSCANPIGGKDELFCSSGKWVTVTGETLGGSGIPLVTESIRLIASNWRAIAGMKSEQSPKGSTKTSGMNHLNKGWKGWPKKMLRDGDGREEMMLSYAGHLRGKGYQQDDIERLCLEANRVHYEDQLDDDVVLDRARRYSEGISLTDPVDDEKDLDLLEQIDHSDSGNVSVLYSLVGSDLRYVHQYKQWIYWNGKCWQIDLGQSYIQRQMLKVAKFHANRGGKLQQNADSAGSADQSNHLREASKFSFKWSTQCRNKNRLDALKALAEKDSRFLIDANVLDSDPLLLGVKNGVVDLRTGLLSSDSKDKFILKRCSVIYDPSAVSPRWDQFIDEITSRPDGLVNGVVKPKERPYLAHYLQKALGYCLTGNVNEHLMFIAIGSGSNGKNVLLDTFQSILSDYSQTIPPEVLMASKFETAGEQANPNVRKLAGARCAISSESKDGQRLDIAVVKRHTGDGSMTARALHENPITFPITHKLWLMTNKTPYLDHLDDAIKGRLHLIPFDMKWNRPGAVNLNPSIPNADKGLMAKLKQEHMGILTWLVRGAVQYHIDGLIPPKEVEAFTRSFMASQDLFQLWFDDELERCPLSVGSLAGSLYDSYEAFCEEEDEPPSILSKAALGKRLTAMGIESKKTNLGKQYSLRVRSKTEEVPPEASPSTSENMTDEEIESCLADDFIDEMRMEEAGKSDR
jgi:putative DNA primase/helicase